MNELVHINNAPNEISQASSFNNSKDNSHQTLQSGASIYQEELEIFNLDK
jgi:hypothetical protein